MTAVRLALVLIALPFAAHAADISKGTDIYGERCSMCHVEEGQGQGPNLKGVVGRKAASLPGFPYTAALQASGLTWTPDNLDKFLAGPMKLVPGTAMPMIVSDPHERTNLIAFLASQK